MNAVATKEQTVDQNFSMGFLNGASLPFAVYQNCSVVKQFASREEAEQFLTSLECLAALAKA